MKLFQPCVGAVSDRRRALFSALKYTAVFVVTLIILWLIQVLSALIPNEALFANYEKSVYYYSDKDAFEYTDGKRLNAVADNYADAIWLNVAWNMGRENPVEGSLNTQYHNGGEYGVNWGLYSAVIDGGQPNTDYTRYWHGTAIFIRILHLFTDVEGIKIIGFCFFIILFVLSKKDNA